jgi:hypothetical protein
MSVQRKTIKDISDIAANFILDKQTYVNTKYETYGIAYKFTRYGLADFPYVLELIDYGSSGSMIVMYRGTTPGQNDKRALFKSIMVNKNKDTSKNIFEMRSLLELARLRVNSTICIKDNTKLLREKLHELTQNSR